LFSFHVMDGLFHAGCGVGVVRSRRFLGGVGIGFLATLGVGVRFFCPIPTADVQLDHFTIKFLNWEFLLKWYNLFLNFCWNRGFLLCTTTSIDFNSRFHSLYVKESESEILERSELESESDILPPTPQPWCHEHNTQLIFFEKQITDAWVSCTFWKDCVNIY